MLDFWVQRDREVKILLVPFIELFLDKAHNNYRKKRYNRKEYTGNVIRLASPFTLEEFVASVETPQDFHVLVLLSLGGIVEVIGAHLVHRREVKDVANSDHDLIKCTN